MTMTLRQGSRSGPSSPGAERDRPPDHPTLGAVPWLLLLFAAIVAIRISAPTDLVTGDQPLEAAYVRDIVERGAWIVQHDAEGVPASKPPLYNWLAAAAMLAGDTDDELLLKLPSIVAGLGALLLTVSIAQWAAGPRAALFAGVFLLCSTMYSKHVYLARTDMLLTFFVSLQIWAAIRERPPLLATGAALALLTKGPIGVVLPLAALVGWWGWEGRLRERLRALRIVPMITLAALPLLAWLAAALAVGGADVWDEMVVRETADRFVPGSKSMEHRHVFYYLPHMLGRMAPASILAVAALASLPWSRGQRQPAVAIAAWWLLAPLVVLSLIPSKRPDRLFPLLPALALLAGWAIDRWSRRDGTRGVGVALALLAALAVAGGIVAGGAGLLGWLEQPIEDRMAAAIAGPLLAGCGAVLAASVPRRNGGLAVAALAAAMLIIIGFYQHRFSVPARERPGARLQTQRSASSSCATIPPQWPSPSTREGIIRR